MRPASRQPRTCKPRGGRSPRRVRALAHAGKAARLWRAADSVNQAFVLRSPLSGVVVERQLNPGQELRPDAAPPTGLFVISDPSQLWFVLDVSDKDLARYGPASKSASPQPPWATSEWRAHYARRGCRRPQTRPSRCAARSANAERRLKAEMFVTGDIKVPAGIGLLVPGKAVYLRGEQYFVFVDAGTAASSAGRCAWARPATAIR